MCICALDWKGVLAAERKPPPTLAKHTHKTPDPRLYLYCKSFSSFTKLSSVTSSPGKEQSGCGQGFKCPIQIQPEEGVTLILSDFKGLVAILYSPCSEALRGKACF